MTTPPTCFRHRSVIILVGCLTLFVFALEGRAEEEPTFDGRSVAEWTKLLADGDVAERQKAAYALWQLADRGTEAATVLAGALADADDYTARTAGSALRKMGSAASPAVPALIDLISSDRPGVGVAAISILQQLGEQALPAVDALRVALGSGDPALKDSAVWCLARIQGLAAFQSADSEVRAAAAQVPKYDGIKNRERLTAVLLRVVEADPVPKVRAAAANALQFLGPGESPEEQAKAVAVLLQRAGVEEDREVRPQLMSAIAKFAWSIHDPRLVAMLVAGCDAREPLERQRALIGLVGLKPLPAGALARVLKATGDPDPEIRRAATTALAAAEPTEQVLKVLTDGLEDWEGANRLQAARLLGSFGARAAPAVPALIAALSPAEHPSLRGALATTLATTLAEIGEPAKAALPELRKLLDEPKPPVGVLYAVCRLADPVDVRALGLLTEKACSDTGGAALYFLVRLGDRAEGAVPALVAALGTAEPHNVPDLVITLGRLGSTARAARPALERMRAWAEGELRDLIDQALAKIPKD